MDIDKLYPIILRNYLKKAKMVYSLIVIGIFLIISCYRLTAWNTRN